MKGISDRVLSDLAAERKRQDDEWGEHDEWGELPLYHSGICWVYIVEEEVKEAYEAAERQDILGPHGVRNELIQVAAAAIAAIEEIDIITG